MRKLLIAIMLFVWAGQGIEASASEPTIIEGDRRLSEYIHLLQGRRVGLLTNHTATIDGVHLVDTLLKSGIEIKRIFAPEHGFRGTHSAGEYVASSRDAYTGIEIISLYGKAKTPRANDVFGCDIIVVDMQDVGVRYYTYISTLYYMMQTCAEVGVPMLLLDRPNPNCACVDGPIIEPRYESFVGALPIPILYGMTIGELARMINGEGWLVGDVRCELTVVPCLDYTRSMHYDLPVPPSPNLPTALSIALYPSLCYFEATSVSVGRGTDTPFEVYGHPLLRGDYEFTPSEREGALAPPQSGNLCKGYDLREKNIEQVRGEGIDLSYLVGVYNEFREAGEELQLSDHFERLVGVGYVRDMLQLGYSAQEIESVWQADVEKFIVQREPYLIYED